MLCDRENDDSQWRGIKECSSLLHPDASFTTETGQRTATRNSSWSFIQLQEPVTVN
jgi:hypothetical protein